MDVALAHAGGRVTRGPPEFVAVALLHDSPEFARTTEDLDLDALPTAHFGARVACAVRAPEQEHQLVGDQPVVPCDPWVLYVNTADKIVSVGSCCAGELADDPAGYWRHARRAFAAWLLRLPDAGVSASTARDGKRLGRLVRDATVHSPGVRGSCPQSTGESRRLFKVDHILGSYLLDDGGRHDLACAGRRTAGGGPV